MRSRFIYIVALFAMLMPSFAVAQNLPERSEVRAGNKAYAKEDYEKAVEKYTKAMALAPKSFEAKYNLANAHTKSGNGAEAEKILKRVAADSLLSNVDRSNAYYNLGNAQFVQAMQGQPNQQGQPQLNQKKLKDALESYKNAMRFDGDDQEAKYNYAFTKALLESQPPQDENQDQDDQNQDNQDGDGDSDQEQNQDQDDGGDDEQEQEQDQNQSDDEDDGDDEQESQPEERDGEISEQLQQQMLDAIQAQEDKTQEDLKEKAKGVVVRGAKNW